MFLKMRRNELIDVLSKNDEILMSRGIEFHAKDCWQMLSPEWREYLLATPIENLIAFVTSDVENNLSNVPESLKKVKIQLESLQYDRKCVSSPRELWCEWNGTNADETLEVEFPEVTASKVLYRKRIKLKKQHEIDRLVELVSQIQKYMSGKPAPIDSLVDIGAGIGHLSRIISLRNKLPVLAVEGNHQFTVTANSLDEQLIQNTINSETLSFEMPIRYTNFVTEELASKVDDFASKSAVLIGLHCCGDFSTTILKVFQKSHKAKALILLSCCYHKEFQCFYFLNPKNKSGDNYEDVDSPKSLVFPLSRKWSGYSLDYLLREAACHNNENMLERYQKENLDISRYARAHLEKWIRLASVLPEDQNIGMCSVKCVEEETTFEEYIRKAMHKRGKHLLDKVLNIIPKSELSSHVSDFRSSKFDSFEVIRLMFAPAIESTLLDDRIEFLREKGIEAKCVPIFDPKISPRNLAIVAYKID